MQSREALGDDAAQQAPVGVDGRLLDGERRVGREDAGREGKAVLRVARVARVLVPAGEQKESGSDEVGGDGEAGVADLIATRSRADVTTPPRAAIAARPQATSVASDGERRHERLAARLERRERPLGQRSVGRDEVVGRA